MTITQHPDSDCPSGKFGMGCERECNCASPTESCFVHSGGCPTGCAHGYTGGDCWTKIGMLINSNEVMPFDTKTISQDYTDSFSNTNKQRKKTTTRAGADFTRFKLYYFADCEFRVVFSFNL